MSERILICGLNWLGDGIMSMPALQVFRQQQPDAHIALLVKPRVRALWEMCPAVDEILIIENGVGGVLRAARAVQSGRFERAYVLPNSFRSALVPLLGGVAVRIGVRGHRVPFMLTHEVQHSPEHEAAHQSREYGGILDVSLPDAALPPPVLAIPPLDASVLSEKFGLCDGTPLVGLVPGAARGPAKQWPEAHFVTAGRQLAQAVNGRCVVFGTAAEAPLAERVATRIGEDAISLAGKTTLAELADLLRRCRVVIANDSGGMHLAGAAGAAVVGVFGMTDPSKTGALGSRVHHVFDEGVQHTRDIARHSILAQRALSAISPERVCAAALELPGVVQQ